jgi:predicted phage-related endonuclease
MRRFQIIDCEQGTPEWHQARCGKLTGAAAGDMTAVVKSGEAAGRRNLRTRLALETITGKPQPDSDYFGKDMARGKELEPVAFAEFEAVTGAILQRTGFLAIEPNVGCSLDGHIGDFEETAEIKCPNAAIHYSYLQGGKTIPKTYREQCRHGLWVTGAKRAHFMTYNEDFPEPLRLFHVVMTAEELDVAGYEKLALAFLREVDEEVASILKMMAK